MFLSILLPVIVIKIGTNVIVKANGELDTEVVAALGEQIAELKRRNRKVILVTSGAIACGRKYVKRSLSMTKSHIQIMAAYGQADLFQEWKKIFWEKHRIACAQLL